MVAKVKKFVSREFVNTVDLCLFRRFLEEFKDLGGIAWDDLREPEKSKRNRLFEQFQRSENLSNLLHLALHHAKILASDAGTRKLVQLADACGIRLAPLESADNSLSDPLDRRSLALLAYIHHRRIFDCAVDQTILWTVSRPTECRGARAGVLSRHDDMVWKEAFRAAVSDYFNQKYCGRYCDVRWHIDGDEVDIIVSHGKTARTLNVEEGGKECSKAVREIAEDTIRYSERNGWIKIGTGSDRDAKKLIELFAEYLIGDKAFFAEYRSETLYTLVPVQEMGSDFRFRYDWHPAITDVRCRELTLDDDGLIGRRRRRSPWSLIVRDDVDALARAKAIGFKLRQSGLGIRSMKIDVDIREGSREITLPVCIQPPGLAIFQDHAHEDLIFELLERNGLRRAIFPDPSAVAAQ
ncbi:hypothetical protein [Oceaniglobus roseus]|uniref:hypothetical protein n=1 Tax=Oceaniglobus roseus TaxID=1737570 RepID=UPI0012FFDBCD|nr:hypothetical protein [Kandeliimicrobium roseum]